MSIRRQGIAPNASQSEEQFLLTLARVPCAQPSQRELICRERKVVHPLELLRGRHPSIEVEEDLHGVRGGVAQAVSHEPISQPPTRAANPTTVPQGGRTKISSMP